MQVDISHLIHWGPKQNRKAVEEWIHSLCFNWDIHLLPLSDIVAPDSWAFELSPGIQLSAFPILQPSDLDQMTPTAFLILEVADGKSWDFLNPIIEACVFIQNSFITWELALKNCTITSRVGSCLLR